MSQFQIVTGRESQRLTRKGKKVAVPQEDPSSWDLIEKRLLIAYYYVQVLGALAPEHWDGKGGTIGQIIAALELADGNWRKVKEVVSQTYQCIISNDRYVGKTRKHGGGNPAMIKPGSEEEQVIAKFKEEGCSFSDVIDYVNDNREKRGIKIEVSRSAVMSHFSRMQKIVTPIGKRAQGNSDATSVWAIARYGWITQLRLALGELNVDLEDFKVNGILPPAFDIEKLEKFNLDQIVWWDEVHKKCHIENCREGAKDFVQFPRDELGRYDPDGTFSEERAKKGCVLQVKYDSEVRFCLGVAIRTDDDGTEEGVRAELFDYSGKVVISIDDWGIAEESELSRVTKLTPKSSNSDNGASTATAGYTSWVSSARVAGAIYYGDPPKDIGTSRYKKSQD